MGWYSPARGAFTRATTESLWRFETATASQHHLHPEGLPRNVGWMVVLRPTKRVPIDAEPLAVAVAINRLVPATMHRIKLQQMGCCRGITGRLMDMHKLNARAIPESSQHKPADPTETVDSSARRKTAQQH